MKDVMKASVTYFLHVVCGVRDWSIFEGKAYIYIVLIVINYKKGISLGFWKGSSCLSEQGRKAEMRL